MKLVPVGSKLSSRFNFLIIMYHYFRSMCSKKGIFFSIDCLNFVHILP